MGVIVRVPLASGLLTGKFGHDTRFAGDDHRAYNRHGESFDVGETFSGVDFETGLEAVEELRPLRARRGDARAARAALDPRLRRCLDDDPGSEDTGAGARERRRGRAAAAAAATHDAIADVYRRRIAPQVHQRW